MKNSLVKLYWVPGIFVFAAFVSVLLKIAGLWLVYSTLAMLTFAATWIINETLY